jgi:hypothetical protein
MSRSSSEYTQAGKGIAHCRVRHIDRTEINVFSTHLIAEYAQVRLPQRRCSLELDNEQGRNHTDMPSKDDEYRAARNLQLLELIQYVEAAASPAAVVVVTGDLNATPDTAMIGLARTVWQDALPTGDVTLPSDHDARAKRLDYILCGSRTHGVERGKVVFRGAKAGVQYSDHFGIRATLSRECSPSALPSTAHREALLRQVHAEIGAGVERCWWRLKVHAVRSLLALLCWLLVTRRSALLSLSGLEAFYTSAFVWREIQGEF